MTFADKLVFLMRLTSTSNKKLATVIHVDPSLISLIRNGKRPMPKNKKYIEDMSTYFSKKCEGNYQRIALSEALGHKYLPLQIGDEQLASILFDWLTDQRNNIGEFLKTFEQFSFAEQPSQLSNTPSDLASRKAYNFSYYGNEGKRAAVSTFVSHLYAQPQTGTVYLSTDENLEWLHEDAAYQKDLYDKMLLLLKRGFRICYIASPIHSANQGFEAISRWLPLHLTGQTDAFYYPRLRDDLYHRTLIVLPGVASMVSTSIGDQSTSRMSLLSFDERVVDCFAGEFRDFLAKCKPMLSTHSTMGGPEGVLQCISQFESDSGNRIQQSSTLSSITTPIEMIQHILSKCNDLSSAKIQTLANANEMFRNLLSEYEIIDIHSLASVEDVRNQKVPIGCSYLSDQPLTYYTPKLYVAHLERIVEYLETYPNYKAYFRPISENCHSIMVKEGCQVILMRPTRPFSVFEITQSNIAEAFTEYLLPFTKAPYSMFSSRHETIKALKEMIQELTR